MQYLPKETVDLVIEDLPKVCETSNALGTYKQSGWKSTFMKYKNLSLNEQKQKDVAVRA